MTAGGVIRDSVLSLFEVPRHSPRDRAEALLVAIEALHQKSDLPQLTERAALTLLSLVAATAAAVYVEVGELGPQLAIAGNATGAAAEALAAALRELVASGS